MSPAESRCIASTRARVVQCPWAAVNCPHLALTLPALARAQVGNKNQYWHCPPARPELETNSNGVRTTHIITQFVAVTGLLVRYCVQRASVLPNTPLSSMMKGSFVVAPRVLAKLELAAGLRRGHRCRQAAQDCGVIHCAGLPPPLCGAVTSPLSRDESA
jgi:hypothetical protein